MTDDLSTHTSHARSADQQAAHSPSHPRVRTRDGALVPYDGHEIARSIEDASRGLPEAALRGTQLQSEFEITLFDGITTAELDEAVIQVALGNVKDDPAYDTIAARLLVKSIHKQVFGSTSDLFSDDLFGDEGRDTIRSLHRQHFPGHIEHQVRAAQVDARLGELFDLDRLAAALDPDRDDLMRYIGVQTMKTRYLLTDADRRPSETPQYFWMRVAMGLSLNETDPTSAALAFYEAMSKLEYLAAGSTLANAGTGYSQLSNCFVMQMEDDIEHIAKTVRDVMWITKGTGGIGLSVSKLRAEGSPIASNNTRSTGPIPFMHTIDSTLRAVSRGGKKLGALCFYMENWHLDFDQFLDLRQQSGDPYRRTRTANTAVWISDEFMHRVHAGDDWYLFDPAQVSDLVEATGADFSRRYAAHVERAERGEIRFRKVRAREQWRSILMCLQTMSHPWLTWKDTINTRALNDNTGTIHLSNLCTEITLPQDRDNIAVCNLASINLSRHLLGRHETARMDWDELARSTRLAVRQLDNLIDITISSVPESEHSNANNRALGLGVMGFTDIVERHGWSYDSPQAVELIDQVMEFVSWHAIDASADLARERGSYPNFAGSGWSKGLVPLDTIDRLAADRGREVEVERTSRLDWDLLRAKVRHGMRNSTLLAIAPTASIGLVAGTTPGLDPQFSQIFSRSTSAGKFLEVNRNLVADLQELGLWESVREDLLRHQGDVSKVARIPDSVKAIYTTSFQIDPLAFMRVAARAQKWVDQAISRNMYLASRDVSAMEDVYSAAWRMGVKTTYYLHMMPRHQAEQSTVSVNKRAAAQPTTGGEPSSAPVRRGFGAAAPSATPAPSPVAAAAPAPAPRVVESAVPAFAASVPTSNPISNGGVGLLPDPVLPDPQTEFVGEDLLSDDLDEDSASCPIDPQERLNCEACQ